MPTYCTNSERIQADRYELHAIAGQLVATFWRDSEKVASIGLVSPFTVLEQSHATPDYRFHCTICDRPLTVKTVYISDDNGKDFCSADCYTWLDRLNAACEAEENARRTAQEGQESPVIRTLDELMDEAESNAYREIHHPFYARAAAAAGESL